MKWTWIHYQHILDITTQTKMVVVVLSHCNAIHPKSFQHVHHNGMEKWSADCLILEYTLILIHLTY